MKHLRVATLIAWASVFSASFAAVTPSPVRAATDDDFGPAVAPKAPKDLNDVAIALGPNVSEKMEAIAVNPKRPNQLVVVVVVTVDEQKRQKRLAVYRSDDAGRTWSGPLGLPDARDYDTQSAAASYAADGRGVYVAFADYNTWGELPRILVTRSDDNGATWSSPVIALQEDGFYGYSSPRLATPVRESDGKWLYLTAEIEPYQGNYQGIGFANSADYGQTWTATPLLATGNLDLSAVWGHDVAGGVGGEVLVTLFRDKRPDGDHCINEAIEVLRSGDHGATFSPPVAAETQGCGIFTSATSVKIGHQGAAHLVYGREGGQGDAGDIEYIWSPGPPYTTWSQPVTVNDDALPRTQHSPSLATQKCGASTILHLVWQDERLSPATDPDRYADIFYARKIAKNGAAWSKNVRVSGKSSLTSFAMFPGLAASQGRVFAAWTDHSDKTDSDYDYETDVYGSGILSGVSCP